MGMGTHTHKRNVTVIAQLENARKAREDEGKRESEEKATSTKLTANKHNLPTQLCPCGSKVARKKYMYIYVCNTYTYMYVIHTYTLSHCRSFIHTHTHSNETNMPHEKYILPYCLPRGVTGLISSRICMYIYVYQTYVSCVYIKYTQTHDSEEDVPQTQHILPDSSQRGITGLIASRICMYIYVNIKHTHTHDSERDVPHTQHILPHSLPRGVTGLMSPYPTVHNVMIAHHILCIAEFRNSEIPKI